MSTGGTILTSLPSDRPVRLGIVGCGAITRAAHLPVIAGDRRVEVTVLCDRDRGNATQAARESGMDAAITTDLAELAGKVDAAIVAVPPRFHAPVAIQLMEMGIDVLCEKPLAITVADGRRMAEAARRTGRVLAVALMMRFFPHNRWLADLVEEGEIGEVREVIVEDGAPLDWPMASNSYFDRNATGGGVLFDTGVHLLDRMLWLFGDLTGIAYEDDALGGFESNAKLTGVLRIGGRPVPARLEFSWSHRLRRSIRVVGERGTLEASTADPRTLTLHRTTRRGPMEMQIACAPRWDGRSHYRAQLDDFIGAVRERREPFVTAESALHALAVIEAAYALRTPMAQPWLARIEASA
ncbi:Gfo/Idh/MocA family protein [Luteimonas terricola]|uniref:Gfo/Idh/MocA family protein n=1 Tax=Luteimonas terricola TaxID=645597 RepID=UPI001052EA60|nr:Gfo/Idh/MocA family oxidoreductase [Luteimonas terricola]